MGMGKRVEWDERIDGTSSTFGLRYILCNELGEVNAGWIPARPASVDQVHTNK